VAIKIYFWVVIETFLGNAHNFLNVNQNFAVVGLMAEIKLSSIG
jgi:hypothetical protein